ncbi:MAG: lycopene cyclase domain-containing protein [bacterium]|nr:lycopene cyclase domain-containing protein [bacterium]
MYITTQYVWLSASLGFLFVWLAVYLSLGSKKTRKEMFVVSLWTSLLGLTEPLFVPEYWDPPTLFNLAQRTGFDIESIIFSFAVGGIAVVIYETIFQAKHQAVSLKERLKSIHRLHYFFLSLAPLIFVLLWVFTKINPIYSVSIAMFVGAVGAIICRRDLTKKILVGGAIFLGLYLLLFSLFNWAFPGYIDQVWNFDAISGIKILGVPIEELLFALTLGMLWSSLYEHLTWRT